MLPFSAPASGLGWLSQFGTALLLLLEKRKNPSSELYVELLDDLELRSEGQREFVQAKHSANPGSLTDRSPDLWKTIRVWASGISSGSIDVSSSLFTLYTTKTVISGSACSLLRAEPRDSKAACEILSTVSEEQTNVANAAGYKAFQALTPGDRLLLVKAMNISDGAATVTDIGERLQVALQLEAHDPGILLAAATELLGWWFLQMIEALQDPTRGILAATLTEKVHSIFRSLRPSTLPIEPSIEKLCSEWADVSQDRRFIRQLRIIEVNQDLQIFAWQDYLRSTRQFSEWTRLQLLIPSDVEAYRRRLTDAWRYERASCADKHTSEPIRQGRLVYDIVMRLDKPIRPDLRDEWIMRGSFHEMADVLRVGWHPDFATLIESMDT
jgi:hypothetical protein